MKFGEIAVGDAQGALLAHSLRSSGLFFKKGRLLTAADVESLKNAGIESVVAARLEPGDIGEDVGTSVGEDLAFTALDAIPVIGQLGALGMGIYSMIEAFEPHHAPTEKIVPTGISFNPEGEMSGSGYV